MFSFNTRKNDIPSQFDLEGKKIFTFELTNQQLQDVNYPPNCDLNLQRQTNSYPQNSRSFHSLDAEHSVTILRFESKKICTFEVAIKHSHDVNYFNQSQSEALEVRKCSPSNLRVPIPRLQNVSYSIQSQSELWKVNNIYRISFHSTLVC